MLLGFIFVQKFKSSAEKKKFQVLSLQNFYSLASLVNLLCTKDFVGI